mgnify:CR=1 FL=1
MKSWKAASPLTAGGGGAGAGADRGADADADAEGAEAESAAEKNLTAHSDAIQMARNAIAGRIELAAAEADHRCEMATGAASDHADVICVDL